MKNVVSMSEYINNKHQDVVNYNTTWSVKNDGFPAYIGEATITLSFDADVDGIKYKAGEEIKLCHGAIITKA